jgi:hypothetical protein
MLQRPLSARRGQLALNGLEKKGPLEDPSRVMEGKGLEAAARIVEEREVFVIVSYLLSHG